MKRYLIILLFILILPVISECDQGSPKEVIEKYYQLMMNSCWCCNPHDWSCPDNPFFSTLLTKKFNPIGEREELQVSLPLRINSCKEEKNKASCDVTYFIIGEMTNIYAVPFADKNHKETVTLRLIKESGVWKINSIIQDGEERDVDGSNVVSVSYTLKNIDKDIKYIRKKIKEKKFETDETVDLLNKRLESLEEAKKIIKKREKYGVKTWN